MFGSTIDFNYPGGESTYRTGAGSCVSCCLSLLSLLFCLQSLQILFQYKGTSFTSSRIEGHYSQDYNFTEDSGFQIAVGIHNYGHTAIDIVDPSKYLSIKAELFSYNDKDGEIEEEIELHDCTKEELQGDQSKFYPLKKSKQGTFEEM